MSFDIQDLPFFKKIDKVNTLGFAIRTEMFAKDGMKIRRKGKTFHLNTRYRVVGNDKIILFYPEDCESESLEDDLLKRVILNIDSFLYQVKKEDLPLMLKDFVSDDFKGSIWLGKERFSPEEV
jgi:hypothetical protein